MEMRRRGSGLWSRMGAVAADAREQVLRARVERLERRNDRLAEEVGRVRSELEHERSLREQALEAVRGTRAEPRPRRGRRFLRTAVVGGAAYVLGARAGRERYERLRSWARAAMEGKTSSRRGGPAPSPPPG
ncbi:MAG TPA: hypothetical protein VNO79_01365 [Actinomycetota bacterium]|nr:hypothetical protein [Actinomycetota bacterium]